MPADDANAVRHEPEKITAFPQDRIIRHAPPGGRRDQVALTHRSVTTVYETPAALCEALLEHHPEIRGRVAQAKSLAEATIRVEREARADRAAAAAELAAARVVGADAVRRFRWAALVLGAAVFLFALSLGALA